MAQTKANTEQTPITCAAEHIYHIRFILDSSCGFNFIQQTQDGVLVGELSQEKVIFSLDKNLSPSYSKRKRFFGKPEERSSLISHDKLKLLIGILTTVLSSTVYNLENGFLFTNM